MKADYCTVFHNIWIYKPSILLVCLWDSTRTEAVLVKFYNFFMGVTNIPVPFVVGMVD